jgi:hypothetical protein
MIFLLSLVFWFAIAFGIVAVWWLWCIARGGDL